MRVVEHSDRYSKGKSLRIEMAGLRQDVCSDLDEARAFLNRRVSELSRRDARSFSISIRETGRSRSHRALNRLQRLFMVKKAEPDRHRDGQYPRSSFSRDHSTTHEAFSQPLHELYVDTAYEVHGGEAVYAAELPAASVPAAPEMMFFEGDRYSPISPISYQADSIKSPSGSTKDDAFMCGKSLPSHRQTPSMHQYTWIQFNIITTLDPLPEARGPRLFRMCCQRASAMSCLVLADFYGLRQTMTLAKRTTASGSIL